MLIEMDNQTDTNYGGFAFHMLPDPRTKDWFLIESPSAVAIIIVTYLLFVTKFGPAMMKNRKEFQLRETMLFYNGLQIVYCALLVAFSIVPVMQFNPLCTVLSFASEHMANARLAYAYFILKIVDLIDTVIFVLRKKNNQITFLHIFHHAYLVFIAYVHTKYLAGTQVPVLNILNGGVHVFMYYYYLMTSLYNRPLWWKKYLTTIQIVQLSILAICNFVTLVNPSCEFPKLPLLLLMLTPNLMLVGEFASFYKKSYGLKSKRQ